MFITREKEGQREGEGGEREGAEREREFPIPEDRTF